MTWLISDANIIIDLESGEVLDEMFRLPHTFSVPNVLYAEELETHHEHLPGMGLVVLELREEYVDEAYRLGDIYKAPGYNDLLALSLAKQEACPLLTGDWNLRQAAENEDVDVRGTLWIMERLFEEKILDISGVSNAYDKMKEDGRRLPWGSEVKQQLKKMRS